LACFRLNMTFAWELMQVFWGRIPISMRSTRQGQPKVGRFWTLTPINRGTTTHKSAPLTRSYWGAEDTGADSTSGFHRLNHLQRYRLRSAWHSAQRRKGGGQRPGDSRAAECHVGLCPPKNASTKARTKIPISQERVTRQAGKSLIWCTAQKQCATRNLNKIGL